MKSSMYAGLLLATLLVGSAAAADSQVRSLEVWEEFKAQYDKSYTQEEDTWRMQIFLAKLEEVERFNREESAREGYTIGISSFSDMTPEEFEQLLGDREDDLKCEEREPLDKLQESFLDKLLSDRRLIPDYVNWTETGGRVTPVKKQGFCSNCWAMAAAGLLEGQLAPNNRELDSLSVQNIMDCTRKSYACDQGGLAYEAVDALAQGGGIMYERDYPTEGRDNQPCKFDLSKSVIRPTASIILPCKDEVLMKKVVALYGPIAVSIGVDPSLFECIIDGIYPGGRACVEGTNHAVLVVGYGTDPNKGDYWLIKNSWGTTVHDGGYLRLARGQNICNIAERPVIAMF